MQPQALPGFRDFYPADLALRDHIFRTWRQVASRYGFEEYDGPPLEPLELYTQKSGAEIAVAPSGRFVYGSNRGHDSIAIYSVDPAAGTIEPVGWEPVQGKKPRFFCFDPDASHLYAANEDSHAIVEFNVNPDTGKLAPTGQVIETGSPACIVFKTQ